MYKPRLLLRDKNAFLFVLKSFLIWRVGIFLITVFATRFVPLFSHNYLGNGYSNYINNPVFWGHFNFDGEHYLSIAQSGYQPFQYFFFPVFPVLMGFFSSEVGLIISNLFFLIALIGIYKLVMIDYKEQIAKLTIILFLVFPTSFYFGVYYTENLFLAILVSSFYLARKNKYFLAAILASFLSATRVVGIIMFPVLITEYLLNKKRDVFTILKILLAPIGLIIYMYYLRMRTGDALIFFHQVAIFGQQRSSTLVLLPQVFYRYILKILPVLPHDYFPALFTTYLEFGVAVLFLILIIYGFFKLRVSYSIYAFLAFIIPTFSGSFSSMLRYVLFIFLLFILSAVFLEKIPKVYKYIVFSVMILLLVVSCTMFWRGYWLS